MIFVSKARSKNNKLAKFKRIKLARHIINKYPLFSSDILMDNFFKKNYKSSLKTICTYLLLNSNMILIGGNLIIKFKTKEDDRLASFITYGNLDYRGSNILKIALGD